MPPEQLETDPFGSGEAPAGDQQQEQNTDTRDTDTRDYDSEARDMGWTPKEKFRGDPDRWVDSKTFVERGEKFMPILKSQLRKSEGRVDDLQTKLSTVESSFKEQSKAQTARYNKELETFKKMTAHALKLQKDNFETQYRKLKEAAVEEGDVEEYRRLEQEQAEQAKRFDEPQFEAEMDEELSGREDKEKAEEKGEDKTERSASEKEAINKWVDENDWYRDNRRMALIANGVQADYQLSHPNSTLEESLEATLKEMKEMFPEQFEEEKQPSDLAGGNRNMNGAGKQTKGWSDMSEEAKANTRFFIENGTFKNETEAARHYWSLNNEQG